MNGPEHYLAAERLLSDASFQRSLDDPTPVGRNGLDLSPQRHASLCRRALTHATLAHAAATALAAILPVMGGDSPQVTEWSKAIGAYSKPGDVVPAEILPECWPPQHGDTWADRDGDYWLCESGGRFNSPPYLVCKAHQGDDGADEIRQSRGPMRLVSRIGAREEEVPF